MKVVIFMTIKRFMSYLALFLGAFMIATQFFTNFAFEGLMVPYLVILGYFTILFIVAQITKNNSIVDMHWGMGFVIGSWLSLWVTEDPTLLSYMLVALITVWGLRLSYSLFKRNFGKPEDFRYRQWREEWGDRVVIIAFFRVFMVQGTINFIVGSAPYSVIRFNDFRLGASHNLLVYLALAIALIGLFFEVVGDWQLKQHIKERSGGLMTSGLWSITRHPNYFGEILLWTGLYLTGVTLFFTNSVNPIYYLILLISPMLMSGVLIRVSTPLLEEHMQEYEGWDDYTKEVPMIFPWSKPNR